MTSRRGPVASRESERSDQHPKNFEAPPFHNGGFSPRTRKWLSAEPFGQQLSPSRILVLFVTLRWSKQALCLFGTSLAKITRTLSHSGKRVPNLAGNPALWGQNLPPNSCTLRVRDRPLPRSRKFRARESRHISDGLDRTKLMTAQTAVAQQRFRSLPLVQQEASVVPV